MILIRGINGEEHAKRINEGLIGCRDLLSTLAETHNTGYSFSEYYEKYCVKAVNQLHNTPKKRAPYFDKVQMLLDEYVPYMYLTYFHIVNEKSEEWLESNFDENARFIYYIPKLDRLTNSLIGQDTFFGQKMKYVDRISNDTDEQNMLINMGLLRLIGTGDPDIIGIKASITKVFNALMYPLFHRVVNDTYNEVENEFRIIKIVFPNVSPDKHIFRKNRRVFKLKIDGIDYFGTLAQNNHAPYGGIGRDIYLHSDCPVLKVHDTYLFDEVVRNNKTFEIVSEFADIDIRDRASKYGYIGNKEDCRSFIRNNIGSKYYDYNETIEQIYTKQISDNNEEGLEWIIRPQTININYDE